MFKRLQLLAIAMLLSIVSFAQSGYVGDYIDFKVPTSTDSRHPDIYTANWSLNSGQTSCVTLTNNGIYGATVHIDSYFTGSIRVVCRYTLYKQGKLSEGTVNKTADFNITCNAVTLNPQPSSMSLKVGEKDYITYTSSPSGKWPTVTYSSSNTNVATVGYSSGQVTAMSKGYATITLSNSMGPDATVAVSVDGGGGDNPGGDNPGGENPGGDNPGGTTIKAGDWFQDYTAEGQLMWFYAYTNAYTGELCCQVASNNKGVSSCINTANGKVTIPSYAKGLKVTHVNNAAFLNLDGLTELVIPETVQYVQSYICAGYCDNLRTITCLATTPPANATNLCSSMQLMTLYVPKGCKATYQTAKGWKDFGTILEIGETKPQLILSADPSGGNVESGTIVYLTAKADDFVVSDASIYYTTDGATPSKSSTKYTSSGITITGATTIKAIAYKDGYEASEIGSWSYTITENPSTKEAYAVLDNGGNTVTFFYDSRKGSRGGININNNYSDNPYANVTTAIFDASFADYRPTSTAYWFYNCNTLTTIKGIENLKTDNVTDMNCMFFCCFNLTSLDLSSFNTSNVTDMSRMFRSCNSLTNLNINGFKTDNVTDMNSMFYHCYALKSLDLSSFSTHNVTDMYSMFGGCTGLTIIDINSFKTDNVTRMSFMFEGCTNLQTIYASDDWSTEKVTSGTSMFRNCTNLIGGQGTTFDASHTNHTYARIDGGSSYPGYFTRKNTDIAIDEINFPDENFRNHLLSQNYGADKVISKEELSMITSMSVEGKNISNLSGIELFTYLEILNCFGNQLRNLDLSGNKNLRYLMCCYNKLTTIDLSNNINIEQIRCDNNIIKGSGLDAMINSLPQNTSNTKRFILLVDNSNNTEENACSRAQSSVIKEKGWKVYYYNGSDNDMNGWVELEDSEATDVVVINKENIPDPIFRNFLLEQDYGKSGVLLPGKLAEVKRLDVSDKGISDLKGIECFSALEWLRCDGNSLTTLDVSKNLSLQSLWCHNNRIVKLVLPNSSTLKTVLCSRNRISGSAMDELISNLPDNWTSEEHNIAVVDYSKNDEENICTNSQVTQIKNKGWSPQYLETSDNSLSGGDYEGNEITIMTSNSGYATFYARNFTYSLPNELSALVPSGIKNNKLTYTSLNSTVVPNGTPVILVSNVKTAKAYTLTITGTSPYYSGTNLLCGSDEATTTFGNGYHYKLSYGMSGTSLSDVFGWYWGADNGGSFMTEGHKAWLVVPKSATTTRGFTIDGETTGITTLESSSEESDYYDLQGRRVVNPTEKGIYIKNGKKIMVK